VTPPRWLHWPSSWSPSDLSTLRAWYKADAISGLSNADAVTSWIDSSGSGYALSQVSTGTAPDYRTSVLNGLPVVRFWDDGKALIHDDTGITVAKNIASLTIATVSQIRVSNASSRSDIVGITSGANTDNYVASLDYHRTSSKHCGLMRRTGTESPTTFASSASYGATTFYIRCGLWDWSAGNVSHWLDGEQDPSAAASHGGTSNTENVDNAAIRVGGFGVNTSTEDVDIAEIVIAETKSTDDREKLEGYLAHKWGLTSNLPSTHPYKSSAP
jgi:hypothetical protein